MPLKQVRPHPEKSVQPAGGKYARGMATMDTRGLRKPTQGSWKSYVGMLQFLENKRMP